VASSEHALWVTLRTKLKGRYPTAHVKRIENAVEKGTPDVNYCIRGAEGWLELKEADLWPVKGGVLRLDHYTNEQRIWHKLRNRAGGRVFVLLQVSAPEVEWLLFGAQYAADRLGYADRKELSENALVCGPRTEGTLTLILRHMMRAQTVFE
jgi:hypothetical protein